jgi:hypothetical protein
VAQKEHERAPAAEYMPPVQSAQALTPPTVANFPAMHCVHVNEPLEPAKPKPPAHESQVCASAEYLLLVQTEHTVDPADE